MARAPLLLAVAFLSAGALSYEILLVRAFAIAHFHHFAYLAVGTAMLGFGAGGVWMALRSRGIADRFPSLLAWAAAASAVTLVGSPALALRLPLDATRFAWDPEQWALLGPLIALLALPFGAGGLAVLLALAAEGRSPGRVYAASFAGAGGGAILSLAALAMMLPERALAVPALIVAPGALAAARLAPPRSAGRIACWLAAACGALALVLVPWRLEVSPYKGLRQVEGYPGARRVSESAGPIGWLVEVEAPAFRYAPGLSLEYRGAFPRQAGLFIDGATAGGATDPDPERPLESLVDFLPTALSYALGGRDRVLVIGAGDGMEIANAAAHGAREVTAAELHPGLARRAEAAESPDEAARVRWRIGDARGLLARTSERFDLVTLGVGGSFGAAAGGVHALDEDFLHTVEAYELCLRRLSDRGVLSVTRWLAGPPREPVRAILTVCEALRRIDPALPARGLIVMRSWATATILAGPAGFTGEEISRVRQWASTRGFDVDWSPGLTEAPRSPFNLVDDPVLFRAARAGVAGREPAAAFASEYPFLVTPVNDARPYARHFLRPGTLFRLLRSDRGAWLPFTEWGTVAVVATLILSALAAVLFLLVPLAALRGANRRAGRARLIGYFALIGFAYLAAELAAIQQLHLLLGHPIYAVTATLAALLVCSGAGSVWSDRLPVARARSALAALSLLLGILAFLLLGIVHGAQAAPLPLRAAVAVLTLVPAGFLMGAPFPLGLRALAGGRTARVAWAWAANGFASTTAAPLSALIALEWGSRALLLCAAAGYAGAMLLVVRAVPGRAVGPRRT